MGRVGTTPIFGQQKCPLLTPLSQTCLSNIPSSHCSVVSRRSVRHQTLVASAQSHATTVSSHVLACRPVSAMLPLLPSLLACAMRCDPLPVQLCA